MSEASSFHIRLAQQEDYRFEASFDQAGLPALLLDEPAPMGAGLGPNASRLLAAAVGDCLSASLLFCLRKFRQEPGALYTDVSTTLEPNEQGRLRVSNIEAHIHLGKSAGQLEHFGRCLQQFEDFCVVTDSIRSGIPVQVKVVDGAGNEVYAADIRAGR